MNVEKEPHEGMGKSIYGSATFLFCSIRRPIVGENKKMSVRTEGCNLSWFVKLSSSAQVES